MKYAITICISVIIMCLMQMTRDYYQLPVIVRIDANPQTISDCYNGFEKPYAFCSRDKSRKFLADDSEMWENL